MRPRFSRASRELIRDERHARRFLHAHIVTHAAFRAKCMQARANSRVVDQQLTARNDPVRVWLGLGFGGAAWPTI